MYERRGKRAALCNKDMHIVGSLCQSDPAANDSLAKRGKICLSANQNSLQLQSSIDPKGKKRALIIFSAASGEQQSWTSIWDRALLPAARERIREDGKCCFCPSPAFCSLFFPLLAKILPKFTRSTVSLLLPTPFSPPLLPLALPQLLHHVFVRSHRLHELLHVFRVVYVRAVRD